MKRRTVMIGSGVGLATILAGCLGGSDDNIEIIDVSPTSFDSGDVEIQIAIDLSPVPDDTEGELTAQWFVEGTDGELHEFRNDSRRITREDDTIHQTFSYEFSTDFAGTRDTRFEVELDADEQTYTATEDTTIDIGDDEVVQVPQPIIDFTWGGSELTIAHEGGDAVTPANSERLEVVSDSIEEIWFDGSGELDAGDQIEISASPGELVEVIWVAPDRDEREVVASFSVPE